MVLATETRKGWRNVHPPKSPTHKLRDQHNRQIREAHLSVAYAEGRGRGRGREVQKAVEKDRNLCLHPALLKKEVRERKKVHMTPLPLRHSEFNA